MRRKALIVLLALGTIGGYASGFASLRHCRNSRRESFEQHVAQVCVDAARKSDAAAAAHAPPAPQQPQTFGVTPVIINVSPGAAANTAPAAQ